MKAPGPRTSQKPKGSRARAPKLSWRQARFVEHMLATGNATESARQAGYTGTSETLASRGWQLQRIPQVRDAIRAGLDEKLEAALSTRLSRTRWLLGIRDGTILVKHVLSSGQVVTEAADAREQLKAAELLARMHGDLLERVLVSDTLVEMMQADPGPDPEPKRE